MNLPSVLLFTLQIFAILREETPSRISSRINVSLPLNLYFSGEFFLPLGRPNFTPSARFLANASFVRWEIKFLSISADNPKAKAKTLL